jgi:phenylpropionate dioxygenase-like ring-hydroxylating dioxygenase large terminal subunit
MQEATGARLIAQLRAELAAPPVHETFRVPADRYTSAAHHARELALFAGPFVAAASRELVPGACLPVDVPEGEDRTGTVRRRSALLVRDVGGTVRAFKNACRHRATRLVDAPCAAKAITCPYHAWTYDLAGKLAHVPHPEAFPGLGNRDLVELPCAERHGLVWLGTADAAGFLGELDADLAALDLGDHVVWKASRVQRACNWKLVVEAFLDGYHIRVLHRDSVYRFFLDAASVAEPVGPHIRAVTARRTLRDRSDGTARELTTPSFLLFPATTVIAHPDFVSLVSVRPLAPDRTDYQHVMLVPSARAGEREHWDRSWALIEEGVFQGEDMWVCERVQRGLAELDELLFGSLEHAVAWFHAQIDLRCPP